MESGDIAFTDADGHAITLDDSQIQSASVDLRLGDIRTWSSSGQRSGEPRHWWLSPFRFTLASTCETVAISSRIGAIVAGKSSVARRGLQVEAAGFVDPGWPKGQLTLEMIHFGDEPIQLFEGMPICQIVFYEINGPVARPYGAPGLKSRYMHQMGPTAPREDPR